jgi:hypothetical protein
MAFFRSHWVRTLQFEPLRSAIDEWAQNEGGDVPGYVGVWHNQDLDEPEFRWVAVETTERAALENGGAPALRRLVGLLAHHLDADVKFKDTEEVHYLSRPDAPGPSLDLAYRSMWFVAEDLDGVRERVVSWQQREADLNTFVRTWLVRGIDNPAVHSISAEFTSVDTLRANGVAAFEGLYSELRSLIAEVLERRNLYGGVAIQSGTV